jgi:TatD DNase family protein
MGKKKKKPPLPVISEELCVIDTHCHLDMIKSADDIETIVCRAKARGVSRIITVGINPSSSQQAIGIAEKFDNVYATVGTHPHNVQELNDDAYNILKGLCTSDKVVAYGEVGLDFVKKFAPVGVQLEHYARQVALANKVGLPLVIHDREAHNEIMQVLRKESPFSASGVMHCFSGNWDYARQVLDLDFYISIPGVVTFSKATVLHDVVRKIPLDRLILETDAPFLAPAPYRGRTNLPEYILFTAEKIAELRNISLDDVARATTENALKLFNIPTGC